MNNWIEKYLLKLFPSHTNHIILYDKDDLLSYSELKTKITDSGYKILQAANPIDVRILYELQMSNKAESIIIVTDFEYKPLPDILQNVHLLTIGYRDLFQHFDDKALKGLSFNALSTIDAIKIYEDLGYDATVRFLLENLYHIDFDSFRRNKTKERFIAEVAEILIHRDGYNESILKFISEMSKSILPELMEKGLSKENVFSFLQNALELYDIKNCSGLNFQETSLLKTVGNLIVQRLIQPVKLGKSDYDSLPPYMRICFYYDDKEDAKSRLDVINDYLDNRNSLIQDKYDEWFQLSPALGEGFYLALTVDDEYRRERFLKTIVSLNERFQQFIKNVYWQLFSHSGFRYPIVISRVQDYLRAQKNSRKALIVIDGMNLWQWHIISEQLKKEELDVNDMSLFAYLPTITAWSRQSLFAGSKPDLTKDNRDEEKLFIKYWMDKNFQNYQIKFFTFGLNKSYIDIDEVSDSCEIMALVNNDLDNLMHGAVMGNHQLLDNTVQWIEKIKFVDLIKKLKGKGFTCYITSDHGSIEASPLKNLTLSIKNLSTSRSKRHIQFADEGLMHDFINSHKDYKLNYHEKSVFLYDDTAFVTNENIITHGGSHLLELLIPLGVVL